MRLSSYLPDLPVGQTACYLGGAGSAPAPDFCRISFSSPHLQSYRGWPITSAYRYPGLEDLTDLEYNSLPTSIRSFTAPSSLAPYSLFECRNYIKKGNRHTIQPATQTLRKSQRIQTRSPKWGI